MKKLFSSIFFFPFSTTFGFLTEPYYAGNMDHSRSLLTPIGMVQISRLTRAFFIKMSTTPGFRKNRTTKCIKERRYNLVLENNSRWDSGRKDYGPIKKDGN